MKMVRAWLVCVAGFPLYAGTIDASRAATAFLQPGDALVFAIPSWNYSIHAAAYGLPVTPSGVSFTLISAPSLTPASFEADLQSADGLYSVSFGALLSFSPGYISSAAYAGAVSTLAGAFYLPAAASQQIFGSGGAELVLRNLGPAILLGLPPNAMQQDLFVSLSGGPLAVGALHGAVSLQESLSAAPEPSPPGLLIVVGAALCLYTRQRKGEWRTSRNSSRHSAGASPGSTASMKADPTRRRGPAQPPSPSSSTNSSPAK